MSSIHGELELPALCDNVYLLDCTLHLSTFLFKSQDRTLEDGLRLQRLNTSASILNLQSSGASSPNWWSRCWGDSTNGQLAGGHFDSAYRFYRPVLLLCGRFSCNDCRAALWQPDRFDDAQPPVTCSDNVVTRGVILHFSRPSNCNFLLLI